MNMHHLRKRGQFQVIITFLLFFSILAVLAPAVLAQQPPAGLPAPGEVGLAGAADVPAQAGLALSATDPRIIVAKIIRVALGFLGTVALVLIIYGGYLWMTSAGNEEQIDKAKKVLTQAVIGLAIILSAFAITQFIINKLLADLQTPPLPPPQGAPARVGGGALGSGIVESHYPSRGQPDVPRNARIILTFKEKIDSTSIPESVKLIPTADIDDTVRESPAEKYVAFTVANTEDLRTFVFTPVERAATDRRQFLGSTTADTDYTVYLCGTAGSAGNCASGGIKLFSGQSAFQGRFTDYTWSFTVGTFLDVTPPQIQSIIPLPDNAADVATGFCPSTAHGAPCDRPDRPRNSMVQVNFNEAVLPTVASGKMRIASASGVSGPPLTHGSELEPGGLATMPIKVGADFIAGEWQLGNQYRSAEFVSAEKCAQNSCGEDVFCLPAQSNVAVRVLAASLVAPGDPSSAGLFDGLEDIAGNSLDGNGDGLAQGPAGFYNRNTSPPAASAPGDNAQSSFYTGNEVLLGSAIIEHTAPETTYGTATPGAAFTAPITLEFNRALALTTFSSRTLQFSGTEQATGAFWDTWWTTEGDNAADNAEYPYGLGRGRMIHGGLWEETDYITAATSQVRDLFQNCYYPGGGAVPGGTCITELLIEPTVYCCNGVACASGDVNCQECGFD